MRAAALVRPQRIELCHLPDPAPGPGEVLIAVRAVGVCGSDVHFYLDGCIGDAVAPVPYLLGHEFAGEVVAHGPGVTSPPIGTRVAIDPAIPCGTCRICQDGDVNCCPNVRFPGSPPVAGCLCNLYAHPADLCVPLPESVSLAEGAMLEPLAVALHAVDLASVHPGDRVAILGAGPIGLLLLQLVRASGTQDISIIEPVSERRETARQLGATAVCNPDVDDPVSWIDAQTDSEGVDVVLEAAWGGRAVEQAIEIVRPKGHVVLVGIPREDQCAFSAGTARRKELAVQFSRRMKPILDQALERVRTGQVRLENLITHRFPLEEADRAFRTVASLEDGVVKAMIEI